MTTINDSSTAIYRVGQIMRLLGINRTTLYRYQQEGLLPRRQTSPRGKFIFYPEDVDKFKRLLDKKNGIKR
jgi:DNA-binding transcriptional MerR regulator